MRQRPTTCATAWRRPFRSTAAAVVVATAAVTVRVVVIIVRIPYQINTRVFLQELGRLQKQTNAPLQADHPERPTMTLGWLLAHPRGSIQDVSMLRQVEVLLDCHAVHEGVHGRECRVDDLTVATVSRPGRHRNGGVLIY